MASFIASVNGVGLATLDYGSGSPQEAAAFLAYLNAPVGNTTADRQRPGVERLDQFAGRPSTGRRPATGPACAPPLRWRRTTASTSSGSTTPPRSISSTGRSATRNTGAGRSTTTRPSTTRRRTSRLPSSSPPTRPRSPRESRSDSTWGAPGRTSTTGPPTSCSSRPTQGFMPGFLSDHNYVQAPGSESDSNLLLDTTTGTSSDPSDPGDPYDWAAARGRLRERAHPVSGRGRQERPVARDRVQLGLFQPRQANDQPGQRPVAGRLAGRACSRPPTTAPTSGTCAIRTSPAATTRRASTAGARTETTD